MKQTFFFRQFRQNDIGRAFDRADFKLLEIAFAAADTDFTPEELEPDERGFLKQTILSVFKKPGDLVGDAGEQVLKETIGAGKDVHGTRYKMNGAFAEASGKAAVMININPGTTASQEESGDWVPAADVLEADVRTLAKAVGKAADSYYEQGLHRTHAAKLGGPAL